MKRGRLVSEIARSKKTGLEGVERTFTQRLPGATWRDVVHHVRHDAIAPLDPVHARPFGIGDDFAVVGLKQSFWRSNPPRFRRKFFSDFNAVFRPRYGCSYLPTAMGFLRYGRSQHLRYAPWLYPPRHRPIAKRLR